MKRIVFYWPKEWLDPLHYVDLGEALVLLLTLRWVRDHQLGIVEFEIYSKIVVDSLYGSKCGVSNYSPMINGCRRLLAYDLVTFDVRFIRRQANKVAHSLARMALCHVSFRIYIKIPSFISTIIINEMH